MISDLFFIGKMGLMTVITTMRALVFLNTVATGTIATIQICDHKEQIKNAVDDIVNQTNEKINEMKLILTEKLKTTYNILYTKYNNTKGIIYNRRNETLVLHDGSNDERMHKY